jgi:hypothetical protein
MPKPQKLWCNFKKLTLPDDGLEFETMLFPHLTMTNSPYPLLTLPNRCTTLHAQYIKLDYVTTGIHTKKKTTVNKIHLHHVKTSELHIHIYCRFKWKREKGGLGDFP